MNKISIILALLIFSCHGGNDDLSNTCGVEDPVRELDWIQTEFEEIQMSPYVANWRFYEG